MRILAASLFHEGNSFSRLITAREGFVVTRGDDLLVKAEASATSLGGAVRELVARGCSVVPGLSAVSPPGGPVDHSFFDDYCKELADYAGRCDIDGIYLDLHGAMVTDRCDDPEGALLRLIRGKVGTEIPIAVSLDLHAHVTPQMLDQADIVVACKENPHVDYAEAGQRAVQVLIETIEGAARPVTVGLWLPLLTGARLETGTAPLSEIHALRRNLEKHCPDFVDVSVYNTTTLIDVAGAGQCVTVATRGNPDQAMHAVRQLARALWEQRDEFKPDFIDFGAICERIVSGKARQPLIVGDQGDRVLAGTAGDGTYILHELTARWPTVRAAVPLTDPDAVEKAREAGGGAVLNLAIGGQLSEGVEPIPGPWRVCALGDGHYVQEGPFLANEPAELGRTAVLRKGEVIVLATEKPGFTQDPAAFRSQGIEPTNYHLVVCKSGYHFKISFGVLGECLVADTPGLSNYRPGVLPFKRRRPVYPEDPVVEPEFEAHVFV